MATPAKTSPDYDPINEALDIGYGVGRSEERKTRQKHVERARRGGARTGSAQRNRQAEEERRRRAEKTRNANARMRANRARVQDERTASARRGAYRAGAADVKRAQADAARQARRSPASTQPKSSGMTAPNVNLPVLGGLTDGIDRTTSARIIVLATAISAIVVVVRDARASTPGKTTVQVGHDVVQVPNHLRSLGGVFVMGTVSLIVNEVNPGIGLALGVSMGVAVIGSTIYTSSKGQTRVGFADWIGGGLFAKTTTHPAGSTIVGVGGGPVPSSNDTPAMLAWIAANPSKAPHPGAGANDYWNAIANGQQKVG